MERGEGRMESPARGWGAPLLQPGNGSERWNAKAFFANEEAGCVKGQGMMELSVQAALQNNRGDPKQAQPSSLHINRGRIPPSRPSASVSDDHLGKLYVFTHVHLL